MEVAELKQNEERLWDEYVLQSDESTFFHQIGWKNVVEETYGHKPIYLVAKENDEIKGILPLFLLKSKIFGKKLVSLPFAPYGGVCADDSEVEGELVGEARNVTDRLDLDYLELKYSRRNYVNTFPTYENYVTFILELDKQAESIWDEKFNNKLRNSIRKAYKSNLELIDLSPSDFYRLYSENMKNLGTPVHAFDFFQNLKKEFKKDAKVMGVANNGKIIASTLLLSFRDVLISGWTASDRSYNKLNPNNFLYWEVIKFACENDYSYFDFGRSLYGSGTYKFKKPWGCEKLQLYYQYYSRKRTPDYTQKNPKRQKFSKIWRRIPSSLTTLTGPFLRKHFP